MSSLRKIESARRNGAKSRGPKTPEGKERSCMNALQHGFAANKIVLTSEERPQFEALREQYHVGKFKPADEAESNLVDQMVVAMWRQYRIWASEARLFDLKIQQQYIDATNQFPGLDSSGRFAVAFKALADDSETLRRQERYEANFRAQYDRALSNLLQLRKLPPPPFTPPDKINVYFCPNKGGKCDDSNRHENCPRQTPQAAERNEPNPISGHLLPAPEPQTPNGDK